MAIINVTLGSIRGRIGGNVFSHNKGGDIIRLGTPPTNPQTSRQQVTRSILGTLASQWTSLLTQAQRDDFDVYAANHPVKNSLGLDVYINGLDWYVKVNARLLDAGLTPIVDAPIFGAPDAPATFAIDVTAATTGSVTYTVVCAAGEALCLWGSLPVSLGSTPNLAQCRLMGYSGLAEVSPWAATLAHGFSSGTRGVFYMAKIGAEGLISAFVQAVDDTDY